MALQAEYKELHKMVTGNGDPQKGLLWLATLQGRLLTDLTTIVEANRLAVIKADGESQTALLRHQELGHYARQSAQARLTYSVLSHVLSIVSTGVLILLALGVIAFMEGRRL